MRRSLFFLSILSLALVGTACNLPSQAATPVGPHSWIDAPQDGSTIPLAPYKIFSHSSDLDGTSQIEFDINGALLATDPSSNTGDTLVTTEQMWTPPSPGTYEIRTRARNKAGVWGDYAVIMVTVGAGLNITPTFTISPTPVATSSSTLTPTSTQTPTAANPTFTLNENAFCREGPDKSFGDVTAIPKGDTVDIQGVSQDGFWYFVFWRDFNVKCWVAAHAGQANGNLQGIPVLVSPDTATPKPLSEPTGYKP
jgi:hypothetical protein